MESINNLDNVFGMHEKALAIHSKRASLIASNLANQDTPGYQAVDLDFKKILADNVGLDEIDTKVQYRISGQASLDGNTVDSQMEQSEYAKNNMMYLANLSILNQRLNSIMLAIKGDR